MKKSTVSTVTKCDECGLYELECERCKNTFVDGETIFCNEDDTHYCYHCYIYLKNNK